MKQIKFFILCLMLEAVFSCQTPMSKESYLKKYDAFVMNVSENYNTFDEKDWASQVEKYDKFTGEWYDKFKDEFTVKEKITIGTYQVKFNYYRALRYTKSTVKELLDVINADEIRNRVRYYKDNNMHNDLKTLYEEAQKAGKAAEETVTEILKELKINIEDLRK